MALAAKKNSLLQNGFYFLHYVPRGTVSCSTNSTSFLSPFSGITHGPHQAALLTTIACPSSIRACLFLCLEEPSRALHAEISIKISLTTPAFIPMPLHCLWVCILLFSHLTLTMGTSFLNSREKLSLLEDKCWTRRQVTFTLGAHTL